MTDKFQWNSVLGFMVSGSSARIEFIYVYSDQALPWL